MGVVLSGLGGAVELLRLSLCSRAALDRKNNTIHVKTIKLSQIPDLSTSLGRPSLELQKETFTSEINWRLLLALKVNSKTPHFKKKLLSYSHWGFLQFVDYDQS